MMTLPPHIRALQEEVCRINKALPAAGLVTYISGNSSGIDRAAGLVVIKPSGMEYAALSPDACAVVELAIGRHLSGGTPSVDTPLPPHEIEKWWTRYHTTYGQ